MMDPRTHHHSSARPKSSLSSASSSFAPRVAASFVPTVAPRPTRSSQLRCRAEAVQVEEQHASPSDSHSGSSSGGSVSGSGGGSMSASAAMAAKIAAARTLARRLAEERQAASQAQQQGSRELPEALRSAEDASVAAASQAARADSLSRALRKADNSREQLQRLKAENDVLKDLLMQLAKDKNTSGLAKSKLEALLSASLASGTHLSISNLLGAAAAGGPAVEAEPTHPEPPTPFPEAPPPAAPAAPAPFGLPDLSRALEGPLAMGLAMVRDITLKPKQQVAEAAPPTAPAPAPPAPLGPPSREELGAITSGAVSSGHSFCTFPPQPVPVAGRMYMYYNKRAGPLANARAVQLKIGTNKWETIDIVDMAPVKDLPVSPALPLQDWWFVQLDLPYELFKFDFVFMDPTSGQVDNNNRKDFLISLAGGPSEQQLLDMRIAAVQAQEQQRLVLLEQQQRLLMQEAEAQADGLAAKAREQARVELAEQHREAARKLIAERRQPHLAGLPAAEAVPGVYCWLGGPPRAGKTALLAYNRSSSNLAQQSSVLLHYGYDGWWNKVTKVVEMRPLSSTELSAHPQLAAAAAGGSWWNCAVEVPLSASLLDFVMSNKEKTVWDNNRNTDFHAQVMDGFSDEQLLDALYTSISKEHEQSDLEVQDRRAAQAVRALYKKVEALQRRTAARHQVVYTVPSPPVAGQPVEIVYNPELTPLRGRPEVWVKGSWDRWSVQQQGRSYCVPLSPDRGTGGLGFHKTTVQVPDDVWGMDLVFTDDQEGKGGFIDDNRGVDYHFPVQQSRSAASNGNGSGSGAASSGSTLRIVHVAVEMAPIAKVGGMGDVVTALGRAVQEQGHSVEVVLPKYDCINYAKVAGLRQEGSFACGGTNVRVWKGEVEQLPTTFLEPENGHFWVGCIYGRKDDHVRFKFFCDATMEYLNRQSQRPNVIHCHDWPTAAMAWADRGAARVVFTIHNLSYGVDLVGHAMATCDVATTVSPTYAREISGSGAVAPHLGKMHGILNGIDGGLWDPESDPFLPLSYTGANADEGKAAARKLLRQRLNLAQVDVPIVSCVTRLVAQKGIHLIKHAAWRALERGGQFVLLGSAPDGKVQAEFNALKDQLVKQYHDRAALVFTYDEPLSHLIYAASDLFLVPSMFEPCGLTQMIAMNYGALPVVRRTGGLADTVFDLDIDEERAAAAGMSPNGFVFESTDTAGLDHALNRAMAMWFQDRRGFREVQARVMQQDWSWYSPALDYVELYYKALRA